MKNNIGYTYALVAGLMWGLIGISAINLSYLGLNSYEISFLRVTYAFFLGLIYLRLFQKKDKSKSEKKSKALWGYIVISGVVCQGLLNIFYSNAVTLVGSVTGIMLMATGPIFTIIFCKFMFNEKLTNVKIFALVLASFGAGLLITEGNLSHLNFNYMGVVFGILSGLCYGIFPIFNKKIIEKFDPVRATVYSFGVASIFLMFFLNANSLEKILDLDVIKIGLFYGLVPTLGSYIFYSRSMIYIPPSSAGIISLIEVPATTFVGILFLHEIVGFNKGMGIAIVLLGVFLSKFETLKFRRKIRS